MLENVSYRYKIPLALTLAIFLTECAVTAVLLGLALADARRNVVDGARSLANATAIAVRVDFHRILTHRFHLNLTHPETA
ncbi:hypothetical protein [Burkholderia multivorans]|uniref:hypothetical protein n=1 Tax=Burkholderia multivorans TaxID=87883 RepID=UPI000CFE6B2B|nr:hypothetical protein [Burkholderia multivorans]PRG52777.1 hypothetical protein C6T63_13200 [Burkholderia multivorans]